MVDTLNIGLGITLKYLNVSSGRLDLFPQAFFLQLISYFTFLKMQRLAFALLQIYASFGICQR